MPWISLPYNDPRNKKYAANYNVKGIPVLVVINKDLTMVTDKAKLDVI